MENEASMQEFPPPTALQVTLANWRKPPFNKWAFQHVCEIVPSAEIPNDRENIRELPTARHDFADFSIEGETAVSGLDSFLRATDTDGFLVMRQGEVIHKSYYNGMERYTPHILMSVSKSVLGLIVGILVERGKLDLNTLVTSWIPEVQKTAYAGATLRDLIDMRVGGILR